MIFFLLFLVAVAYAFSLNTPRGQVLAKEHTWATVVAGVGMVLLALTFVLPGGAVLVVVAAFAVAGGPMIVRSLWNKWRSGETK
jgi:hypothetical protein